MTISIHGAGLVTAVGCTAPATCAAIRGRLMRTRQTGFVCGGGAVRGMVTPLDDHLRGRGKLLAMTTIAAREALSSADPAALPILLCVADPGRRDPIAGINATLLADLAAALGAPPHPLSQVLAWGRAGALVALAQVRELVAQRLARGALIVACDTLLTAGALAQLDERRLLLTAANSDGVIPADGAAAVLVTTAPGGLPVAAVAGAAEPADHDADQPATAAALMTAWRTAATAAGWAPGAADWRIVDHAGRQEDGAEIALTLSRLLRTPQPAMPIWQPAASIGDCGAALGLAPLALAHQAWRGGWAPGGRAAVLAIDRLRGWRGCALLGT